jgi:hypothetical protein
LCVCVCVCVCVCMCVYVCVCFITCCVFAPRYISNIRSSEYIDDSRPCVVIASPGAVMCRMPLKKLAHTHAATARHDAVGRVAGAVRGLVRQPE